MNTVTGMHQLESAELEIKKGLIFNTSGCCASGTLDIHVLPTDAYATISEELDTLDIDALAMHLSTRA